MGTLCEFHVRWLRVNVNNHATPGDKFTIPPPERGGTVTDHLPLDVDSGAETAAHMRVRGVDRALLAP